MQPLRAGILDAYSHRVTILAASGDAGATTTAANGPGYYPKREVNWQASDPLVTGVGGTELVASGGSYTSVAWNDTYDVAVDKEGTPAKRSTVTGYHARPGYSLVTGVGTINASQFVHELAGKKP